jgi:hypothetical protein
LILPLRLSGMKLKQVCALSELSKGVVIATVQACQRSDWDAVAVQGNK